MPSIFELKDSQLEELFGTHNDISTLKRNADIYKDEIASLLSTKQRFKVKPLLKKLFALDEYLHKGKIWLAFGDDKGARYCFSQIEEDEFGYKEAQDLLKTIIKKEV